MPGTRTREHRAEDVPATNGTVGEIAPGELTDMLERPRATLTPPRREDWVDMPSEYPGFKLRIWKNHPAYLVEDLPKQSNHEAKAVLKRIVLEHNGWGDEEGYVLPQPDDDEFWRRISNEQLAMILVVVQRAAVTLPNSMLRPSAN